MRASYWAVIGMVAALLLGACEGKSLPAPKDMDTYENIQMIGSDEFIKQTRQALILLEEKDPQAFQKAQAYIGVIQQGLHSGMWVWENPPRYEVGDATAFSSITWYASTIAHDATHSELYTQYALAHPGKVVPPDVYTGVEIEILCNEYQLQVLKRLQAPQNEIEYMAGLDGTHCDLDGDGDCDLEDYQLRNW